MVFLFTVTSNAQVTLITTGSAYGCQSTGVELQASGGSYYWLYNQDPIAGVQPIDSNIDGKFTVYKTAYYCVLADQGEDKAVGLSNPSTLVTIETPPVSLATVNYYPILDYAVKDTFTICSESAAFFWNCEFQANENVLEIDGSWNNQSTGVTSGLVGAGTYICTITTNNGCSYVMNPLTITYVAPIQPKIKLTGMLLESKVEDYAPFDSAYLFLYQWYKGKNQIVGATSETYTATITGKYSVEVSQGGCSAKSKQKKVTVVNEKLSDIYIEEKTLVSYRIFNMMGQSLGSVKIENLQDGIYIIRGYYSDQSVTSKKWGKATGSTLNVSEFLKK